MSTLWNLNGTLDARARIQINYPHYTSCGRRGGGCMCVCMSCQVLVLTSKCDVVHLILQVLRAY